MENVIAWAAINPCLQRIEGNSIYLRSNGKVDFFRKFEAEAIDSAAFYYSEVEGDFSLSARVSMHARFTYDAVFLMARTADSQWLKLAFERGNDGANSIVSVFTDPWSDDANGEMPAVHTVWLRLSRVSNHWGLHYSLDGDVWRFVRTLGFLPTGRICVGYGVQSPLGQGFEAEIHDLQISLQPNGEFRNGK